MPKLDTTVPGRAVYTIEEAARLLGMSRNGAYEAAHRGQIPTIRIGKLLRVPRVALDRMLRGEAKASEAV